MWIFAKDGFVAMKQHNRQPRLLVVRARIKNDIEALMSVSSRQVIEDTAADYRFRAYIDRDRVADRIAEHVCAICYEGFKPAVSDKRRLPYYLDLWSVMADMQEALS